MHTFFLFCISLFISVFHNLVLTRVLCFTSLHPCSFCFCLSTGTQWEPLRQTRLSIGYTTKLDPRTYRGQEGKLANHSSSLCYRGSCCLSPSICGQRESADRPACFYLPNVSIRSDEACQGFTGTGNVSLAPGVSEV